MNILDPTRAIEIMRSLEPTFFQAAELACQLQEGAVATVKNDDQNIEISTVTTSDLAVQEFVLNALLQTDLIHCKLLAEEDTPSTKRFLGDTDLYLTLDPIDGTANYAAGRPYFAFIIGLHSKEELLYTFLHYPRFAWTAIMHDKVCEVVGGALPVELPPEAKNSIMYSFGDILFKSGDSVAKELQQRNLKVIRRKELGSDIFMGSTALFIAGHTAGLYVPNPLCVDGLTGLHYAITQGYKIFTQGPTGELDFSQIVSSPTGSYHPGYYLAIRSK